MQVIYAGLRNGQRDQAILEALQSKHVAEVAADFRMSPSGIRKAAKRVESATVFELQLVGGGVSQCRSARSIPTLSARLRWVPTEPTAAPFSTSISPAG